MAEKRMFSKDIISSDVFISMPLSSQALYFHLCLNADDEGFVDNPKTIMRMIGSNEDDIKVLLSKRYVLAFDSGVIVIKHWFIHNWIRQDRLKPTKYQEELATLIQKDNGAYTEKIKCQSNDSQVSVKCQSIVSQVTDNCQHRLDKISIDKNRIDKISLDKININNNIPTYEEIKTYCEEKGYEIDIEDFMHYWTERDWKRYDSKIKKYVPIKDLKGTIRTWAKNQERYAKEEARKDSKQKSQEAYIKDVELKARQQKTSFEKTRESEEMLYQTLTKMEEKYGQDRDNKNIGENETNITYLPDATTN